MPSEDFPESTPPEQAPFPAQPPEEMAPRFGTEEMWAYNKKLLAAGEQFDNRVIGHNLKNDIDAHGFDNRVMNLNFKTVADAQAQALFWQNILERSEALKLAAQERQQNSMMFFQDLQQKNQQFADQRTYQAGLSSVDLNKARMVPIVEFRTIEPTREETIQDGTAAAVNQAVDTVSRAMVDRTQTSAANVSELSAARQVADTNIINTLSEVAGAVNAIQTQSASTQGSFQALTNQVAELVGAVQALTGNQPKA